MKYKYSGCGTGLGRFGTFSLPNSGEFGKNVVFWGRNMCILITKEKKDILTISHLLHEKVFDQFYWAWQKTVLKLAL